MQPKDRRLVTEQALEEGVENLDGRISAVETMAGIAPGTVVDAQTANVILQPTSQTRVAVDGVIRDRVDPVEHTAHAASDLAQDTATRVDAFEVLTGTTPGNVDDATIGLHVGQPNSHAHRSVLRVLTDASTNLFDSEKVTLDTRLAAGEGTPTYFRGFSLSDPIQVHSGSTYSYAHTDRITYFDETGTYLGYEDLHHTGDTKTTPEETHYVRLTLSSDFLVSAQMNAGSTVLPYEPWAPAKIREQFLPEQEPDDTPDQTAPPYLIDTDGLTETFDGPDIPHQDTLWESTTTDVHAWYDQLLADHPDYVSRQDLGISSDGTNHLYAYTLKAPPIPTAYGGGQSSGTDTPYPTALLLSGVHGSEKPGVYHVWRFAKALCEEWETSPVLDAIRWNVEIIIVPISNPYAYNNPDTSELGAGRVNANGVDLARNFSADWQHGGEGTRTYSGPSPLSEPETIALDLLMQDIADRAIFGGSFHSFGPTSNTDTDQIWQAAADPLLLNVGKRLVSRMSRKWRKDHNWITADETYLGYADRQAPPGSEGRQMVAHGFPGSTFETSRAQYLDGGSGQSYSARAMTLGYEATVNYIAMALKTRLNHPTTRLTD